MDCFDLLAVQGTLKSLPQHHSSKAPILDWQLISYMIFYMFQCQSRFDPCVRKIPWQREWQPTQVFLPEESHGWRSLVGYNPQGHKESDKTSRLPCSARLPCSSPTPRACSNSCPSSRWCHPNISSSVVPFSSCLQSFQHQGLFQWVSSSHQVAKVLEFQLQHRSFQWIFRTDFL